MGSSLSRVADVAAAVSQMHSYTALLLDPPRPQSRAPRSVVGPHTSTHGPERLGAGRRQQPATVAPRVRARAAGHRRCARRGRRCRGSASLCCCCRRARSLRVVEADEAPSAAARRRASSKISATAHCLRTRASAGAHEVQSGVQGRARGERAYLYDGL